MSGGYCEWCDTEFFDSDDAEYYKDLVVCRECLEFFEENDGETGKLIIIKCKECGQRKSTEWKKYKPKGRPKGSVTTVGPRTAKGAKGTRPLFEGVGA